ncbi:MAG TPA: hypothetical protein VGQ82_11035, partial [Chthoniobacterales bacterium]|nr:hypothetical protein [Chthoniobacterales bacterium]
IKRIESIALSLRTSNGIPSHWLDSWNDEREEFLSLGLIRQDDARVKLTERGKLLADSVAAAFV